MEELFLFVLEVVLELLVELGVGLFLDRGNDGAGRRVARVVFYALAGIGLGWGSTLIWPHHAIASPTARLVWLAASPFVGGAALTGLHALRGWGFSFSRELAGAVFLFLFVAARYVWAG